MAGTTVLLWVCLWQCTTVCDLLRGGMFIDISVGVCGCVLQMVPAQRNHPIGCQNSITVVPAIGGCTLQVAAHERDISMINDKTFHK
jgi:hypothetical protein